MCCCRDWLRRLPRFEWQFFYASAEQAIGLLFSMSSRPEEQAEAIVKHMARRMFHAASAASSTTGASLDTTAMLNDSVAYGAALASASSSVPRTELSHLFFVIGHVAIKLLVHTEGMISRLRKAQQGIKPAPSSSSAAAVPTTAAVPEPEAADAPAPKSRGKATAKKAVAPPKAPAARASSRKKPVADDDDNDDEHDDEHGNDDVVDAESDDDDDDDDDDDKPKKRRGAATKKKPAAKKPAAKKAPAKPKAAAKGRKGKAAADDVEDQADEDVDEDEGTKTSAAPAPAEDLQTELGLNAAAEEMQNEALLELSEKHIVGRYTHLHMFAPLTLVCAGDGWRRKRGRTVPAAVIKPTRGKNRCCCVAADRCCALCVCVCTNCDAGICWACLRR